MCVSVCGSPCAGGPIFWPSEAAAKLLVQHSRGRGPIFCFSSFAAFRPSASVQLCECVLAVSHVYPSQRERVVVVGCCQPFSWLTSQIKMFTGPQVSRMGSPGYSLAGCTRLGLGLGRGGDRMDGRKNTPLFMPGPGHGPSGGELGRPPPGLQLARWVRIRASIRGPRLSFRRARPTWRSAAHRSVLLSTIARSLCTRNARGRAWRMRRNAAAPVD